MKYLLDRINDNLLEKLEYDDSDTEFEKGKVLFSDIQKELDKHRKENTFENAVRPLMKWMSENTHPHTTAIVKNNVSELVEGLKSVVTDEYIID